MALPPHNLASEEIILRNDDGPTGGATKGNFPGADGAGDVSEGNYRRASIPATAVALAPPASKRYLAGLAGPNDVPRLNCLTRMGAMK